MKTAFRLTCVACWAVSSWFGSVAYGGAIFISGHDPIWHANFGDNPAGAASLATTAIAFARAGSTEKFLFVESKTVAVPSGNAHEAPFLTSALGFPAGDFDVFDAADLNALPDFRGALDDYSAIVVASDHGGMLSAAELGFLNDHSDDVIDYINSGGGLAAFSQSNATGLIGTTDRYGFLPFLISSTDFQTEETGNVVTPFGASLGLADADVNGNFSHNFFEGTGGMNPVDLFNGDPTRPLSLAFEGTITDGGIPEPTTAVALTVIALGGLLSVHQRRR